MILDRDTLCVALDLTQHALVFYGALRDACSDSLHRDVFESLRTAKQAQNERIQKIIGGLAAGQGAAAACMLESVEAADVKAEFMVLAARYAGAQCPAPGHLAIDDAMQMEISLSEYFDAVASEVGEDAEKAFLRRLAEESRGHYIYLDELKSFEKDPEAYARGVPPSQ